jgi:putative SOS response-associated peptidase YedK
MCGRYTLFQLADLNLCFPWIAPPDEAHGRYNIAPTQPVLAALNVPRPKFEHLYWGLVPSWAKDVSIGSKMINARAETLAEKPAFRNALKRRRCILPADGFYEWRKEPDGKTKTPMYIRLKNGSAFGFAGLWEEWQDDKGNELQSCTVITTGPNELMKTIHDRMPVILTGDAACAWLEPGEQPAEKMLPLLKAYPADAMEAYPVSRRVNSPTYDEKACVERVSAGGLFD